MSQKTKQIPMTDFDIHEVVSILVGVKPKPKHKSKTKKSSKKLKESNVDFTLVNYSVLFPFLS